MYKKPLIILLTTLIFTTLLKTGSVTAEEFVSLGEFQDKQILPEHGHVIEFDSEEYEISIPELEGNELSEETKREIEEKEQENIMSRSIMPFSLPIENKEPLQKKISQPGIASFNNKGIVYDIYDSAEGGNVLTYISSIRSYTPDAAVLDHQGNRYRIVLAGLDGWISDQALAFVPTNEAKSISHYSVDSSGDLIHYLTKNVASQSYTSINNGPAPDYLQKGRRYFSYDGHFFYTNIRTMLEDYKSNHRNNALNKNKPFFNYFQFLPYRTKTSLTKEDFDSYLRSKGYTQDVSDAYKESSTSSVPSNQSKLVGQTEHFINQMNKYGSNAAITFTLSIHETGWGRSYYARSRNNMFGHSVFDSNTDKAIHYDSVEKSIWNHNARFVNWNYLDYTGGNYRGGMLGNKQSGMNVRYASDPYWGEKAAAHYLELDRFAKNKDYGKYSIGYKNNGQTVNLRKEATTKSPKVLTATHKYQSFVIYDTVRGEKINGNDIWYKISSDHILTKDRDLYKFNFNNRPESYETGYLLDKSYVYVHSDYITPIGEAPKANPIKKGDVNGDGKINAIDLAMVQSHMLNKNKLSGDAYYASDINSDGKINAIDLAMIQSHMLGKNKIEG